MEQAERWFGTIKRLFGTAKMEFGTYAGISGKKPVQHISRE
jgi:hypothetical protein